MTTSSPSLSIYQLRIVLRGISPLIWRRVLVRSDMALAHLHALLQVVFAWSDDHLHSFHIHGREYGSSGAPTQDVLLHDLSLHRGERFRYVYDFGAYWECEIRLEAMLRQSSRQVEGVAKVLMCYPLCVSLQLSNPEMIAWPHDPPSPALSPL